jgi:hypothetical protein
MPRITTYAHPVKHFRHLPIFSEADGLMDIYITSQLATPAPPVTRLKRPFETYVHLKRPFETCLFETPA